MDPMWSLGWDEGYKRGEQLSNFEIKRLRAALRQIELNARNGDPLTRKLGWVAREALGGKDVVSEKPNMLNDDKSNTSSEQEPPW